MKTDSFFKHVAFLACVASFWLSGASADTVDDFESYADSTALQTEWPVTILPPAPTLETVIVRDGSKSMKLNPDFLVGAAGVKKTFATPQDWSTATSLSLWYHGQVGNAASIDLNLQILNSSGGVIATEVVRSGTVTASWQQLTMVLAGQAGLNDVKTLQIVLSAGFFGDTGVTYIDDIEVEFPGATPGVEVTASDGTTEVSEDGGTDQISVALLSQPTHNVTVTPVFNSVDLGVSPNSRTITTAAWETPASFTVSAVDDGLIEGTEVSGVSFTLTSSDPAYNVSTSNQVVTITDDDFLQTPVIDSFVFDGTNYVLTFFAELNQRYRVEETTDLPGSNWTIRVDLPGINSTYAIPISPDGTNNVRLATVPE